MIIINNAEQFLDLSLLTEKDVLVSEAVDAIEATEETEAVEAVEAVYEKVIQKELVVKNGNCLFLIPYYSLSEQRMTVKIGVYQDGVFTDKNVDWDYITGIPYNAENVALAQHEELKKMILEKYPNFEIEFIRI